jgi:hypothetical protein
MMVFDENEYFEKWTQLNRDQQTRDKIIGITGKTAPGGIASFKNLTLRKLEELIAGNFLNLDETQNSSPSIQEFYEFMKEYPCVRAHGYAVDKVRSDYRVSIEGLERYGNDISEKLQLDFMKLCRKADSLKCSRTQLYSWWD